MKFTITLGEPTESVRYQVHQQGILLSRKQLWALDDLDTNDGSLTDMEESGILTESQVRAARKKLLRKMLLVIGGGEL